MSRPRKVKVSVAAAREKVMAIASDRYVHFQLDMDGRLPQRCRVTFTALAAIEGTGPLHAHRDQSMRLFMKHRRRIEAIATKKSFLVKEPTKWVSIAAEDLDLTP
jgi:hypothetical protein